MDATFDATVARLLPRAAAAFADHTALILGGVRTSYAALDAAAARLASGLRAMGVVPGDRVSLHGPNSWEWIITYHAVARIGAVLNPLNLMLTPPEITYAVQDCGARLVITTAASVPGLLGLAESGVRLVCWAGEAAGAVPFERLLQGEACAPCAVDPESPAMISYTSGTTGLPKGVVLTHRGLMLNAAGVATMHPAGVGEVVATAMPLPHVGGHVPMNAAFLRGATLAQFSRFDPARVQATVAELGAHVFGGAPSMYLMILDAPGFDAAAWRSLRIAAVGGAMMPVDQMQRAERMLGIELREVWGMTELSGYGTTFSHVGPRKPGSIGVALPFVQLRIGALDDPAQTVANGEAGELLARGPCVMRGYWNNPAATEETMAGDGWLRSGDIARMDDDGCIFIVDRKKDMILTGGYNVYPAEIERVLAAHPGVAMAAIGRVADPVKGEIAKAYVVARERDGVTAEELDAFCRQSLAAYKVPRAYRFVDDLPRTPSGKVLRRELGKLDR